MNSEIKKIIAKEGLIAIFIMILSGVIAYSVGMQYYSGLPAFYIYIYAIFYDQVYYLGDKDAKREIKHGEIWRHRACI